MIYFLVFILLTTLSYFMVLLTRRYAGHRRILDYPNERSSHTVQRRGVED
ncbi:MAG TPA: hypothetical protein VFH34_09255 [Anaerolineales bacterium]|nr:hypothetical protein [Anaerolineales bacterium]